MIKNRLKTLTPSLFKSALFLAILSVSVAAPGSIHAQATLSVAQTTTDKKFVPQGNKVSMLYIKLLASGGDATFTSMLIKNSSSQVFFGNHVTRAVLFKDSINSQQTVFEDGQEEEIARLDFPNPTSGDQTFSSFSQTIPSGNTQGYFIVYEISDTAPLSATTNLQLLDIDSNFDFGANTVTNTAVVTGFSVKNITSIAPSVVIPGQNLVGMLKLELKMQGEGIDNGFQIKIANQSANFVSSAGSTTGVTNVYLYKPNLDVTTTFDPNFINNYTLAQSVIAGQFTSPSDVTFSFSGSGSFTLPDGVTKNFFVVYDIGDEMQVTTDTKVLAQVTSLSGKGEDSLVSININTAAPQTPAESLVAGLSFSNLLNIVPADVNFGQLSQIPILQFQIQANHATINVNSVSLQNPGNVPFITSTQDLKNIQSILLYEDTNRDGLFNGTSVGLDTQIGNLQLGTGTNQQDRAVITIDAPNTVDLIVSPFDSAKDKTVGYNQNNARRIFAIYSTGRSIVANPSSTTDPFAIARLENVVGSTNISGTDFVINLSGTLPAAANPEALVNLQSLNLRLDSVLDISPVTTVRGQIKVPMLAFAVEASTSIVSANISIFNVGGTYNKFHQGVSKVWLYRDENNNQELDSADTLLTVNDILPDQSTVSLSGISMPSGFNHFLVLYDIGFLAPITPANTADTIRAEFDTVQAVGSSLIFGGQSLAVAQVSVLDKPLSVTNIVVDSLQQGTYLTSTFNVTVTLANTSPEDIVIDQFYPRIYQSSNLGGTNISSEFSANLEGGVPFTLAAGETSSYTFATKHTTPITEGTARLDAYVGYKIGLTGEASLTRYLSQGGWIGASPVNPQLALQGSAQYAWNWPSYIKSASVTSSGSSYPFVNNDALSAGSTFSITFQNKQNLDENSIVVKLNGIPLQKTASTVTRLGSTRLSASTTTYAYDTETGVLTVSDVGTTSGQILIQVTDNDGNPLPDAHFDFQISTDIQISDVLFFPNPYLRSTENPLRLGFNITQPASITVDIYNNLGVQVYSHTQSFVNLGYNSILIDANADFMTSGIFFCRISAVDISGKKNSAQTRLAVY